MRIFLAMSMTHPMREWMIQMLRGADHQVYDQAHPAPGFVREGGGYSLSQDLVAIEQCDAVVAYPPFDLEQQSLIGFAVGERREVILVDPECAAPAGWTWFDQLEVIAKTFEQLVEILAEKHMDLSYAYTVPVGVQQCRVCGCWDGHACPDGCCWVEEGLCSACHRPAPNDALKTEGPERSLLAYLLELPPHEVLTPEADGVEDARKVLYVHPEVLDELCYERDLSPEYLFFDGDPGDGLPCRFWLDVYSDGVFRICDRSEYLSSANDVGLPEGWVRKTARVVGEFGRELVRLDGSKWGKGVTS